MAAGPSARPKQDVLFVDRPEQLKALGHPLRLRVLEMLGGQSEEPLTNRELSERLGVDPGHLHFHVRMLLRAGLIELVEGGQGREKPYRAVARTVRIPPELIATGSGSDIQAAMLDHVERGWAEFGAQGRFRSAQIIVNLPFERAVELMTELVERARDVEEQDAPALVITAFAHPPGEAPPET